MKNLTRTNLTGLTLTLLIGLNCSISEAGLFGNRGSRSNNGGSSNNGVFRGRQATNLDSSPYNRTGQPLTNFGYNWVARKNEQDARVSQRTGRPVEQVQQNRIRRIEMFGAALAGAGEGLSGAADSMNYSSPSFITPGRTSNFSQQSNWNSFNRNYPTNPDHAPVR